MYIWIIQQAKSARISNTIWILRRTPTFTDSIIWGERTGAPSFFVFGDLTRAPSSEPNLVLTVRPSDGLIEDDWVLLILPPSSCAGFSDFAWPPPSSVGRASNVRLATCSTFAWLKRTSSDLCFKLPSELESPGPPSNIPTIFLLLRYVPTYHLTALAGTLSRTAANNRRPHSDHIQIMLRSL